MKDQTLILQFDGGSRGNPGPAAIGIVIAAQDGTPLVTLGRCIGRATNNVAEYQALIAALTEAKKLGAKKIIVRGDSELIVRQMTGQYRVKNADLKPLWQKAQELFADFDSAAIEHNLRHHNTLADSLANLALDRRKDVTDADLPADGASASTDPLDDAGPEQLGTRFECPRCACQIKVTQPSTRPGRPFICVCGTPMRPST
jgi:ribonuclease HI